MRLLIADDDPTLRLALRMVLEDAGHEVVEAASESEARAVLRRTCPDFALVDAGMSGTGVALWEEMSSSSPGPGRALLLTGDPGAIGRLADLPNVLSKPFDFDRLLARIEGVGPRG